MEQAENRIALIGILVEELEASAEVNRLLHEYAGCILGRMGIPCRERGVSVISVVLDAAPDQISALSGKLGRLPGVFVKSLQTGGSKR